MAKKKKPADEEADFSPDLELVEDAPIEIDDAAAADQLELVDDVDLDEPVEVPLEEVDHASDSAETRVIEAADDAAEEPAFAEAEESPFEADDFDKVLEDDGPLEEYPPDEEPPEEEAVAAEPAPRPKVTALTLVLLFLNVLAALGFGSLFFLDYTKRQEWSYAIFRHDLLMQGLPLRMEEDRFASQSRASTPRKKLDPEQLKEVYRTRPGVKGVSEPFLAIDEAFRSGIRPEHMSADVLNDHFQGIGDPVKTLEEEIERLKTKLPNDIDEAAKIAIGAVKTDADKRQLLGKLWLPLAVNTIQVEAIDDKIQKAKDAELDSMLYDIAQRRLVRQILEPLDNYRPSAPQDRVLDKIADRELVKSDALKKLLEDRLDVALAGQYNPALQFGSEWGNEKRESIEKRQYIAFLLCVLGEAKKLDGTPLLAKGTERAQLVAGLYEYTLAVQALTNILRKGEQTLLEAIRIDREGVEVEIDKKKNMGFVHRHQEEVQKIRNLVTHIKETEFRLKEAQGLRQLHEKIYTEREMQLKDITTKLLAERQETYRRLEELRLLREQLFRAQVLLADAAEINLRLTDRIRRTEDAIQKGQRP